MTTTAASPIDVRVEGATGIIEFARPEIFNALSLDTHRAIQAALDTHEANPGVRVILLLAQGKNFCTGANLKELKDARGDRQEVEAYLRLGHDTPSRFERSPLPVVAAVQGLALAGGMEMLLGADIAFAASNAQFGDQHTRFGLIPGWGASQRLTRLIGLRRALDLFLSVRWIDAETALAWGLVNYLAEPGLLRQTALDYCQALAGRSRQGLTALKRLAREGLDVPLDAGLELEIAAALELLPSEDVSEGIRAFEGRREPLFTS